ncbi:MAG TPA: MazG family protein [Candidatus Sulfotelmatobacter sp.]|nr:MazG family protein [Candidatus Sulfotelmatobacter sp.]
MRDEAARALRELNEVVERLRAPGGCPWDREQTHASLAPYLLEETYEALEAIHSGDPRRLCEELGDVLLQVLMHSAIAAESEGFDVGDVAEVTRAKMVHRHPHVFADVSVDGAAAVVVNWERLKASEKQGRLSVLDGVPASLPALAHAQGVQKRPARLGFDTTPSSKEALARLQDALERVVALAEAVPPAAPVRGQDWTVTEGEIARSASGESTAPEPRASAADHGAPPPPPPAALEEAVGDLLFSAVALARRLRVNSEDALRRRTEAFAARFRELERRARSEGVDLHELGGEEWQRRWEETSSSGGGAPIS